MASISGRSAATALVALCACAADGKVAVRSLGLPPLQASTLQALPLAPDAQPQWSLRTDDGLSLDELDLRDKRSNWLRDLLSIGKSRVLLRVADRLFGVTLWAAFIAGLYEARSLLGPEEAMLGQAMDTLLVPTWPHEAVGGFLAILLVFRTDQAYERFWQARELWATVHSSVRALSMLSLSHYAPGRTRDTLLGYTSIFPAALRQHLRGQRDAAELQRGLVSYFGPHYDCAGAMAMLGRTNNMPAAVLASLSVELGQQLRSTSSISERDTTSDESGQRQAAVWTQMQSHIERLTDVIASCERIKLTPIPLSYSRHTSRFFTLYLLTLPFTLVAECNFLTVPAICIGIGYVLYAMEEIGHVIEEPFSLALTQADEKKAGGGAPAGLSAQQAIARAGSDSLVSLVTTFYTTLSMVLGFDMPLDDPEIARGSVPLEVLPLSKYCAVIELDVANLAAAVVEADVVSRAARRAVRGGLRGAVRSAWTRATSAPPRADDSEWRGVESDAGRYRVIAAAAVERLRALSKGVAPQDGDSS